MQYKGRIIFEGYALADVLVYEEVNKSRQKNFDQGGDEYERFVYARTSSLKSFDELYQSALKTVGEEKAALFQVSKTWGAA